MVRLTLVDAVKGKAPCVRHAAAISRINIPYDNRVLTGEIAVTACGKYLRSFRYAVQTSFYYTDGRRYANPCEKCGVKEPEKDAA